MKRSWLSPQSKIRLWLQRLLAITMLVTLVAGLLTANGIPVAGNQNHNEQTIRSGWYPWEPYQYQQRKDDRREITGLDVQLFREVFEHQLDRNLELPEIGWEEQLLQLRAGKMNVVAGAFPLEERRQYAYFSKPYRHEEIVIYTKRRVKSPLSFKNNKELAALLEKKSLRLGIVPGYFYGQTLNDFINDPANKEQLVPAGNAEENLRELIAGGVDIVPVDHLVGATIAWKNKWANSLIEHDLITYRSPIVALFSKASTTTELVSQFDQSMQKLRRNGQYSRIIRNYLFPVLLNMTVAQDWFFGLEIVGILAFAFSGVLLAQREQFSLFGALLIAALPAVGGGVIRDLIASRDPINMVSSPHYLLIVIGVVVASFLLLRLLNRKRRSQSPSWMRWTPLVDVLDAIGLAAFTVVGVIIAVETRAEPLILWGPAFSAVGGAGGAILRDIVRGDADHPTLRREVYAEIALIWGLALSIFVALYATSESFDPVQLKLAVLITLIGTLVTRLLILKFKIKSPLFG